MDFIAKQSCWTLLPIQPCYHLELQKNLNHLLILIWRLLQSWVLETSCCQEISLQLTLNIKDSQYNVQDAQFPIKCLSIFLTIHPSIHLAIKIMKWQNLGRYASAVSFNIFGWNKGVQKVRLFDLLVYYKLKMGGILAAEEKNKNVWAWL